ncbi:MAG: sulfatase-like hydrolase/transferase [Acidobacteriia bacterium]|nr:sulfatase-like hydrolase/transferase [Terriglobia bacterium]
MALSLSPAAKQQLKDFLICFSLGNLCFLRRWYDLEHLKERSMEYYRSGPADPTLLYATILGGLILTAAFWLAWQWVVRNPTPGKLRIAHTGFLLMLIFPLESVRRYWNTEGERYDLGTNIALLAIEATLFVGMILAARGNARMVNAAKRAALLLTLLLPALLIDFTWARLSAPPPSAFVPRPPLAMIQPKTPRRVLWLLFDEFDQRLAFDVRRPVVALPELDRLRAESLVADHATQTASWTMMALPSLIDGRIYSRVELVNLNTLRLFPEDGTKPVSWRDEPNVFGRAHELGVNTALVGWHHPYCRVIGDMVTQCTEVPNGHPTAALLREISVADEGIGKAILFLFELQFSNVVDMLRLRDESNTASRDQYVQRRQQKQYFEIRKQAFDAAVDPKFGLVFEHFPIPHLYGIYSRERGDFALNDKLSYADNLALVDRTLGELRRDMEQKGVWDSTTVLVSSDHGLRPDVWKGRQGWTEELQELTASGQSPQVPFIVKFAGNHQPVNYDRPFSAVVTADFALAILSGKISNPAEGASWLDGRTELTAKSVR